MQIVEAITKVMTDKGISNRQLCKDCNLNETSFSSFKNGNRTLPSDKLQHIFDHLGIRISY